MVLGFFGKKSDHPLAEIKSAQFLLDDIPKADSLKALQELTDWVEQILGQADSFRLDHEWALLRMFDQAAQAHLRKLLSEYFSVQPLSKFQENRLWTLLDVYYTQSQLCHHDVFTRYREGAKGAAAVKPDLAMLCARGISAITGKLKLAAARHSLVDPAFWKRLSGYYGYAETQGFHLDPVTVYPGLNSSVAQEFAVLVTWYGSSAGNLNPLEGHITERLFSYLGKGLQVASTYNGIGLFVFDIAQPTPPMHATVDATIHPALRFIEAEGMRQQLEGLCKTLEKGILPDSLNLYGAKYEAEFVLEVARQLMQNLSLPPKTRRSPRRKINVNLNVAQGFLGMLEQADVGLSFGAEESETWEVQDISTTGFRCVVSMSRADGVKSGVLDNVKIGSLIGSKPDGVSHWGAGMVRRLRRDEEGKVHIGVEVLSPRVISVPLIERFQSGDEKYLIGLYLNRPADTSGEAWLLMKPETFSGSKSLLMQLDNKEYLLLPLSMIERGDDYDLARYRMMEQDTGSEE
ncbi:MAG: hypothetical protein PXX77_09120 [Gallionella sp.]|nr:hypothetical protein [Gallionella sp.]